MTDFNVRPGGKSNYQYYGRSSCSGESPGLDCVADGHIWMDQLGTDEFVTSDGKPPWASWCLWCGTAVSNEHIEDD